MLNIYDCSSSFLSRLSLKTTNNKVNVEKMFLHHYSLVAVDNYLDIPLKHVTRGHVTPAHKHLVLLFHENNLPLEDEDVAHEVNLLNVLLHFHDV